MNEPSEGGTERAPKDMVVTATRAAFNAAPLGTHLRARDFFDVAELARGRSDKFAPVTSFLYCRSIELSLKAYLCARGETLEEVRARGHDLGRLLIDAFARGLDAIVTLTAAERATVLSANKLYAGHKLAYFDLFSVLFQGRRRRRCR